MGGVVLVLRLNAVRARQHPSPEVTGWRRVVLRDHVLLIPLRYVWILWAAYALLGLWRVMVTS